MATSEPGAGASTTGTPGAAFSARTWMVNGSSEAVAMPSVTRMVTGPWSPTSARPGVPQRVPVAGSKEAQDGRPSTSNVSESPSGSEAAGSKRYSVRAVATRGGEPEITGGSFTDRTVTVTSALSVAEPSETV